MGKRKIVIEKIENKEKLQVTFSKRRKGIFQKAASLCQLCDANAAVIVFSPAGKPYAFGHASVDAVIDRYLNGSPSSLSISDISSEYSFDHHIRNAEFKLRNQNKQMNRGGDQERGFWWEKINLEEIHSWEKLDDLRNELVRARQNVFNRIEELSSSSRSRANYDYDGIEMGIDHEVGGVNHAITIDENSDLQTLPVEDCIDDSSVLATGAYERSFDVSSKHDFQGIEMGLEVPLILTDNEVDGITTDATNADQSTLSMEDDIGSNFDFVLAGAADDSHCPYEGAYDANYHYKGTEMLIGNVAGITTSNVNADQNTLTLEDYSSDSCVLANAAELPYCCWPNEDAPLALTGFDHLNLPSKDELASYLIDDDLNLSPLY